MKLGSIESDEVIAANKYVHSFLVKSGEYQKSPHFKPENQRAVRSVIEKLHSNLACAENMIDFGCGTGFIINLASDLFKCVYGVDVTKEMMEKVDVSSGNITLFESQAESTPFDSEFFDFATAYSFMDHLLSYKVFLKEVYRVLKKGGIFYSDLNPNRSFLNAMSSLSQDDINNFNPVIQREIIGGLKNGDFYQAEYGLDSQKLAIAEPIKTQNLGFLADEVVQFAKALGFSKCTVEYQWFVDQGNVFHNHPEGDVDKIERYLQSLLPLTSSMYKYLRFVFVK